jgi:hypothetical protein
MSEVGSRKSQVWGAHAARVLAMAASPSRIEQIKRVPSKKKGVQLARTKTMHPKRLMMPKTAVLSILHHDAVSICFDA